jgi:hypothetical protein
MSALGEARHAVARTAGLPGISGALERIAADAEALDRAPAFPAGAFAALAAAGALARPATRAEEWALVRAVAAADGSVGRILDGHLNAIERLGALAPEPLRGEDLARAATGRLLLGVWGADPRPPEGTPARIVPGPALEGVKVFCSGAGGVGRALVVARDDEGARRLAYVDLADGVEVDRTWFRGHGLRASESHRVSFRGARVLALLGGPGELAREPLFSLDAIRTAATWAGLVDTAVDAALEGLAERGAPDDLAGLAAGRLLVARGTVDRWLEGAARRADADPDASLADLSVALREAVAGAARQVADEAARALGSRPLSGPGRLERARRDLDLFLLQHRLDPMVARLGRRAIEERAR